MINTNTIQMINVNAMPRELFSTSKNRTVYIHVQTWDTRCEPIAPYRFIDCTDEKIKTTLLPKSDRYTIQKQDSTTDLPKAPEGVIVQLSGDSLRECLIANCEDEQEIKDFGKFNSGVDLGFYLHVVRLPNDPTISPRLRMTLAGKASVYHCDINVRPYQALLEVSSLQYMPDTFLNAILDD